MGLGVLLAAVTYLDRVCISKLAPQIMQDLSLSEYQMSFVFSAFTLAYALFEIPTARWADRKGTRRMLTRIVVWWSSLTIATAGAVQLHFPAGDAVSVRDGRGRRVALCIQHLFPLDPRQRTRHSRGSSSREPTFPAD